MFPNDPPFWNKKSTLAPKSTFGSRFNPFGTQWSPFGYSFVSFWLPLVLFWFPFAPFWHPLSPWLHFGLLSFPFPSSGRVGALLRNFRSIWHFLHPPQEKDVENRICSRPGSKRHPFYKPILRRTTNLSVDTPLLKHVPHDHHLKARIRPWGWLDWSTIGSETALPWELAVKTTTLPLPTEQSGFCEAATSSFDFSVTYAVRTWKFFFNEPGSCFQSLATPASSKIGGAMVSSTRSNRSSTKTSFSKHSLRCSCKRVSSKAEMRDILFTTNADFKI